MLFGIAQPALNPCASVKDLQLTYHLEKNGKHIKSMMQVSCKSHVFVHDSTFCELTNFGIATIFVQGCCFWEPQRFAARNL